MAPKERVAFMLSDDGLNYLFPFVITVDGTSSEQMVPGRVARVFAEESREVEQSFPREESNNIFKTAFLLFTNQVDTATTFAQNCGGGGSAPDKDWGRDENEDDILWVRRCFRKAREMVTTPVRRREYLERLTTLFQMHQAGTKSGPSQGLSRQNVAKN
ncbi:MAG: hypothetical protein MJY69_06060 [Bacteroidales bacterium]|nr:hypothetical protein [Bacteroidales bacterium]